jgi:hypothetical protein
MDPKPSSPAPDRLRTGFRTGARVGGALDAQDSLGASLPPATGVGTLDPVRAAFWQAWRHLFPPHSLAAQASNGHLLISWAILDDPHAHYPYATPVLLRFDADLLDAMGRADARTRIRIALNHEPTLREGLRGYDPFARFPHARVINIG